ncbi:hypothetical protein PR048_007232, partial [Dryococelus australis]
MECVSDNVFSENLLLLGKINVTNLANSHWVKKIQIKDKFVKLNLDTGAQVRHKEAGSKYNNLHSKIRELQWVTTCQYKLGKCLCKCTFGEGRTGVVEFQVAREEKNTPSALGLPTIEFY